MLTVGTSAKLFSANESSIFFYLSTQWFRPSSDSCRVADPKSFVTDPVPGLEADGLS